MNIILELKKSNILGRSGSGFPTGLKWEAFKKEKSSQKYIICNASEGEMSVFKDYYILKNYLPEVIKGIELALDTFKNSQAYIYLKPKYYNQFKDKIKKLNKDIILVKKQPEYIAGEETALLEAIEGKRPEPRVKPPYPVQKGLYNKPTLINNVETFYYIYKISQKGYNQEKFYSIEGEVKNKGVFELKENFTIEQILKETNNWPNFDFFVQAGGGASGEILLSKELKKRIDGIGSIIIFNAKKTDPFVLMEKWAHFFINNNCDKCVPCREGLFRLYELIKEKDIKSSTFNDLLFVLENTSLCALGKFSTRPFKTLIKKWKNLKF